MFFRGLASIHVDILAFTKNFPVLVATWLGHFIVSRQGRHCTRQYLDEVRSGNRISVLLRPVENTLRKLSFCCACLILLWYNVVVFHKQVISFVKFRICQKRVKKVEHQIFGVRFFSLVATGIHGGYKF